MVVEDEHRHQLVGARRPPASSAVLSCRRRSLRNQCTARMARRYRGLSDRQGRCGRFSVLVKPSPDRPQSVQSPLPRATQAAQAMHVLRGDSMVDVGRRGRTRPRRCAAMCAVRSGAALRRAGARRARRASIPPAIRASSTASTSTATRAPARCSTAATGHRQRQRHPLVLGNPDRVQDVPRRRALRRRCGRRGTIGLPAARRPAAGRVDDASSQLSRQPTFRSSTSPC